MPRRGAWGQHHQAKRARAFIARHPWCAACGQAWDLTVDHGRARIYGDVNENDESWWQVLCRSCNAIKGTSDLSLDQIRARKLARPAKPRPTLPGGTITFMAKKPRIG